MLKTLSGLDKSILLIVILEMMGNVVIDKGLLAMIAGPIVGLLVMKGYIDPKNSDIIIQELSTIMGALITVLTLGYGIYHDIETHKIKLAAKQQTTATTETVTIMPATPPPPVTP